MKNFEKIDKGNAGELLREYEREFAKADIILKKRTEK